MTDDAFGFWLNHDPPESSWDKNESEMTKEELREFVSELAGELFQAKGELELSVNMMKDRITPLDFFAGLAMHQMRIQFPSDYPSIASAAFAQARAMMEQREEEF